MLVRTLHARAALLATLLATILTSPAARAGSCSGGGVSSDPAPLVDALRSYRAGFVAPTRVAADSADNLYIADPSRGRIVVREPSGRIATVMENLGHPLSVAVSTERVFVGDGVDGSVAAYSPDWQFLFWLGQGPGEFGRPGDIAVDPGSGNVWVSDTPANHVRLYGPAGDLIRTVGGPGAGDGEFASPMGIFIDTPRARVLIVDQLNARLQVYDLNGNYTSCIGTRGGSPGSFNVPQAVAGDSQDRLYVTDAFEGRIQVLDAGGDFLGYIGEIGDGRGELRVPGDVLIDSFGRLFAASTVNSRLEVFGIDDYTDPESIVPARVQFRPDPFLPTSATEAEVLIEVPGYALGQVVRETLRANGVPAIAGTVVEGDFDGNSVPDLRALFDSEALGSTLPPEGSADVVVTGVLASMEIEGTDRITVIAGSIPDADGDGVADEIDSCPGTPAGEIVDEAGCSVDQRCPCLEPAPGQAWKNHGHYVDCVDTAAGTLLDAGLITESERAALVRDAARTPCGKKEGAK